MQKTTTCLMFVETHGKAEEAIGFLYVAVQELEDRQRGAPRADQGEIEGTVAHAQFVLDGQEYIAMDGGLGHNFTFTPATSIFVTCETELEVDTLFEKLSAGGSVLMPLDRSLTVRLDQRQVRRLLASESTEQMVVKTTKHIK
jgi:predicted 3-demethylubiquinone-9 3-methyltransferase (glyoxalase superfamily)